MVISTSPKVRRLSKVRSRFGLQPDVHLDQEHQDLEHHDLLWSRIRLVMREPFAEFFGTFVMVLFGDGSVAQVLGYLSTTTSKCLKLRPLRCFSLLVRRLPLVRTDLASTNPSLGGKSGLTRLVE